MENTLTWWGYRHTNGHVQAKRYWGPLDLKEARESPFVAAIHGPFEATGREDALSQIAQNT